MELLNAAVAAFAHRAIAERNPETLASEALAYLAAGLQADRAELFEVSADGRSLALMQRFPAFSPTSETISARGRSIAAEAYGRGGVVVRASEHGGEAATAVPCDDHICVFAAYSRRPAFELAARDGLDAIAAMYRAALARCKAEARLADREARLRLLLDQIPAILSTLDTNLVFTSSRGLGLSELPGEVPALVGRSLAEVIGGEETLPVVAARKVLAGSPTQYEWTSKSGRIYENRMEPLRAPSGQIIGVINLGFDVTEQRKAETALRESREELRRLSAAMNQMQEDERRRIAREVHDQLGQRLTALRLDLSLLRNEIAEGLAGGADERIAAMLVLVDETIDSARSVAMQLRPAILDDFGFAAALEHEAESFARRSGIEVSLKIDPPDLTIESARGTALFRVIQEALTNVARHSGATQTAISVVSRDGRIEAEVRDNGRGIPEEALRSSGAIGLIGIRERIYAFDGTVTIGRLESGGTRVSVSVPDEDSDRG